MKILNSLNVKRKREPKNTEESGANPILWNPNKYAKPPRKNEIEFDLIRLRENIKLGQRIEAFEVDAMVDGAWKKVGQATSIGACRIIPFPEVIKTTKLRVRITSSPVCIALSDLGVFKKQL